MKGGSYVKAADIEAEPMLFVAYYRVSTDKQGKSGLGIEAQQDAVRRYLKQRGGKLQCEIVEIESGAQKLRPELAKALTLCRKTKATLVIAKLDRLARNVHVISGLLESGIEFVAVDNPYANKLMVHLLAAFAEHEREQIAARTRVALAAARRRGTQLGTAGQWRADLNKRIAQDFAEELRPLVLEATLSGIATYVEMAERLTALRARSFKGGKWHPTTVMRLMKRLGVEF